MKQGLWDVFCHYYTKDDEVEDRTPTDSNRDGNSPPAFWGLWVDSSNEQRHITGDGSPRRSCFQMKPCLCAVAFMCWGSSPQIAKFECPYRTVPHGDITGAQPTLRSVNSIYIFKPTTTVRFHKRQTFAVRIGKLSRDSHLHIATALWDVGAVGSNRTGNREAGNAAYSPFLTPDCHRSHVSGAFQHTFAVHQLRQSLAAGSCSVCQSTGTRCTG